MSIASKEEPSAWSLSDFEFKKVIAAAGTLPEHRDVLRDRLNEVLRRYREATSPPETETERLFREASNIPPDVAKRLRGIKKLSTSLARALRISPPARRALEKVISNEPIDGKRKARQAASQIDLLANWSSLALGEKRSGAKRDQNLDTALIGLADIYVDHFPVSELVEKLPTAENSHFIRFCAECLSYAKKEGAVLEEGLSKRWRELQSLMISDSAPSEEE